MGVFYESLPPSIREWLLTQKLFYVATAPLSAAGHVNVSPKGGPYFGIIDERTFWYMDLSGSGNETISHLLEPSNGRITVMFNAFEGPPKIVRLFGHGYVFESGSKEFERFVAEHGVKTIPGTRTIIVVKIHQVASSCGFSVPYYDFKDFRPILNDFFVKKAQKFEQGQKEESMERYWAYKNARSIDGLPGMRRGFEVGQRDNIAPMNKMVGALAKRPYERNYNLGRFQLLLVVVISVLLGIAGTLLTPVAVSAAGFNTADLVGRSRFWKMDSVATYFMNEM